MKTFIRFIVQLFLGLGLFIIGVNYSEEMMSWGAAWLLLYWLLFVVVNLASLFFIGPPPLYGRFVGRDRR
jgi:hypothetical protein